MRAATRNGMYAPVVRTTAQGLASTVAKAKAIVSGGAAECNSATTSSSTHTSSVSPA